MFDEMALSKMYFAAIAQITLQLVPANDIMAYVDTRPVFFMVMTERIVDQILQALVNYFQFGRGRLSILLPHLKRAN